MNHESQLAAELRAVRPKPVKIFVRRYRDCGQVTAYCVWSDMSRTEAPARYVDMPRYDHRLTFGTHMHALFARAKREGLHMERETW